MTGNLILTVMLAFAEYEKDDGVILRTLEETGYLCYLPHADGIEVTECLADSPEAYRTLLHAAAQLSPSGSVTAQLPTDCGLSGTLLRPVHGLALKKTLSLAPFADDPHAFCVERY